MKRCIIILLIAIALLVGCTKKDGKSILTRSDLPDYDFYQQTILEVIASTHTFTGTPFVSYILLGIDDDPNYNRHYVHAMISDIEKKRNNLIEHSSVIYPFAFTFDNDTEKLVRYYFPDPEQSYNIEELQQNFPFDILKDFYNLTAEENIQRMSKFSSTNMWNARTYFDLTDSEEEYDDYE